MYPSFSTFRVTFGPEKMIRIPPQHYCVIENPVLRNEAGEVVFDVHGQAKLQHADQEVRLAQEPFALYPGEAVKQVSVVHEPDVMLFSFI